MKEKSIKLLNKAVADELKTVHQYMYFHFHCDDQYDDEIANLKKFGDNYLALQSIERSKNVGSGGE